MNARNLILVLAALALAGGLAFVLLEDSDVPVVPSGPLVSDGAPTRGPSPEPGPSVNRSATTERAVLTGLSGLWSVYVVGPKGEPLPLAKVTARKDGKSLTGVGNTTFNAVDPGEWEVSVVSPEFPAWNTTVAVSGGGQATRTTARLSAEVRLPGMVVDERGLAGGGASLWLLPEGTSHPLDGNQGKQVASAMSERDGSFRIEAKEAGTYRISVGRPGETPLLMTEPFALAHGRERFARLVVPARARLTIETMISDAYKGPNLLTVLAEQPTPIYAGASGNTADGQNDGAADDEAAAIEKKRASLRGNDQGEGFKTKESLELTPEQQARIREAEERAARDHLRRTALVPEGWTTVKSVRFNEGSQGEILDLPEGQPLRFVLYRGVEGFRIQDLVTASRGADVKLTLTPPDPFPPNIELPEIPRTTNSRLVVTPLGRDALPVGLTFTD